LIYKNEKFGDSKHYSVAHNGLGVYTLREFANGINKAEVTLNAEELRSFKDMLKTGGWYEYIRR
tara:strand:- start:290 stop:481 length:192 start_codon:yes stop_codon:yes gene_type:complete